MVSMYVYRYRMKVGERVKWLLKRLIDIILGQPICVEIMTD